MTTRVDLTAVQDIYRLCYVRIPWAWFTRVPLQQQWGDRWEREYCAMDVGLPYGGEPDQILKVAFDGALYTPGKPEHGLAVSVQEINEGGAPWLHTDSYFGGPPVHIMAGASLQHFCELINLAGGSVYAPVGWGQLPELHNRSVSAG